MKDKTGRRIGRLAIAGGVLGLALAPIMVTIKYMTGWGIIPKPWWVDPAQGALGGMLTFAPPHRLWTVYGSVYTVALALSFLGLLGIVAHLREHHGKLPTRGLWWVVVGLVLVIPADAIHSWTWHRTGLRTPTPGTDPLPNTAYAVHMMGMNLVMIGSMWTGIVGLYRKLLAPWLAWSFTLVFPGALLASIVLLPTTPSGALWWFSLVVVVCGYFLAIGRGERLLPRPLQGSLR